MTSEQAFSRRIKKFLSEQPESNASQTIRKIEILNPNFNTYYGLFDDFAFKLGLGIIAIEIVNKNYKTIGYIPSIKYYPDNLLNEEPRTDRLISEASPLRLNKSYEYMAKELLYRIMRVPNLEELILEKIQS